MKYICLLIFSISLTIHAFAQKKDTINTVKEIKARHVGINTTPLVIQFIPFNRTNPRTAGPYNFIYKRFNNADALILAAGVDVLELESSTSNFHLNLLIGWEQQRKLEENWYYAFGASAMFLMGNLNVPGAGAPNNSNEGGLGVAPTFTLGYTLNEAVSISTETMFFFRLSNASDGSTVPGIAFVPPVAMYLNFKLPDKKRKNEK
jgi:hypothetical protein